MILASIMKGLTQNIPKIRNVFFTLSLGHVSRSVFRAMSNISDGAFSKIVNGS